MSAAASESLPTGSAAIALRKARPCRRCRALRPPQDFPLYAHPPAASWATRTWCATCLVERGHLRQSQAAAFARDYLDTRAEEDRVRRLESQARLAVRAQNRAVDRIRERARATRGDSLLAELLDRAGRDPEFAAALDRAARLRRHVA